MVLTPIEMSLLEGQIVEQIKTIFDPEIPINIYELGLIYDVIVSPDAEVNVRMTLTSPGCPVAQSLPVDVNNKVKDVPGVSDATVDIVWDPPWSMDMMSDEAKLELGIL